MDLKFKRQERLQSKRQIEQVLQDGNSFHIHPFKVFHYSSEEIQPQNSSHLKIGISIPKRAFKKAVNRNLLKRRTREAIRLNKNPLKELLQKGNINLWVFLIYTDKELLDYHGIEDKIILILQRLQAIHG